MRDEFINLLPLERQRALAREYTRRLCVVATVLVAVLAFVAALLLLPTYVFLAESEDAKGARLANIESVLSSADEKALAAQLAVLTSGASTLSALEQAPSASETIRAALALPRSGVILSGFAYTPAMPKKPSFLAISGTAATRDVLRTYQLALQGAPFARAADLPVSAYAEDADIAFTITVTLAPPRAELAP